MLKLTRPFGQRHGASAGRASALLFSAFVITPALTTAAGAASEAPGPLAEPAPFLDAPSRALPMETLLVTASRMAVTPAETPSAVTVITREDIERSQAQYLVDLLRDVPGVALAQSGGVGTQAQIRIRGAEANQVLVMIDGVEANDPGGADEAGLQNLMLADVERIEIVRGPQSALWGSDAMAGVIHIITRSDGDGRVSGRVHGGSFGTREIAFSGSTGLGTGAHSEETANSEAPTSASRARGRIAGSLVRYETQGTNISRSGAEADGFANTLASVRATYALLPEVEVFAQARTQRQTLQTDAQDFLLGIPVDSDNETDSSQDIFSVGIAATGFAGQWRPSLRLTRFASQASEFDGGVFNGRIKASRDGLYVKSEVAPTALPSHRTTFALDHEEADFSQTNGGSFFGIPVFQDESLRGTGYTLEHQFTPTPDWGLTGSVRHDTSSDFRSATTYRVGSWWAATPELRLRAAHGTARKNPTFTERFGFYPNNPFVRFIGNPTLVPERSIGTEWGFDLALSAVGGSVSVTLFHERLKDEIRDVFDSSVFPFLSTTVNSDGTSQRYGAEIAADLDVRDGLRLQSRYTWLRALEPGRNGEGADDGTRFDELRRPRHQGSLAVLFDPGPRWSGRLNLSVVGDRPDTDFSTFETVTLQAYALLEASVAFTPHPALRLGLRGTNLTRSVYEDVFGYATPGRAVFGTVEVRLP